MTREQLLEVIDPADALIFRVVAKSALEKGLITKALWTDIESLVTDLERDRVAKNEVLAKAVTEKLSEALREAAASTHK